MQIEHPPKILEGLKNFLKNIPTQSEVEKIENEINKNYNTFLQENPKNIIISLLTKISAFYLDVAIRNREEDRKLYFDKIRSYLFKLDRIEINEKKSFILKGYYYFFLNDFKQSINYFENAKDTEKFSLPYFLGKGFIEYHKKNYLKALEFFKKIFIKSRKSFKEIFYILGLCYYKLEIYDLSESCFLYLLKTDYNKKTKILSALSILYLKTQKHDLHYLNLVKAFQTKEGQNDPNILLYLSEHYFYKQDYKKTEILAKKGLKILESLPLIIKNDKKDIEIDSYNLKSRFLYLFAFMAHKQNNQEGYTKAYKFYKSSLDNDKFNFPAQFGLGQILLQQKNYSESIKCFEFICENNSEAFCRDCFLIMPDIYMRLNNKQKTIEYFLKALEFFPENFELKIKYASYLENFDTKNAYGIYKNTFRDLLLEKNKNVLSLELLNNIGVVFIKENNLELAKEVFEIAKNLIKEKYKITTEEENLHKLKSIDYTIRFNISDLLIKKGKYTQSKKLLKSLLIENPLFFDCYLKISKINFLEKDTEECYRNLDKALLICTKEAKLCQSDLPIYLKIYYLIKNKSYQNALNLISQLKLEDSYFLLFQCIIYYYFISNKREDVPESKKIIKKSAELIRKIMNRKEEKNNIYAANIVASLLAERGRLEESIYIFNSFQELLEKGDDFLYNIALCEFLQEKFDKCLIILESPKSSLKLKREVLYPLVLTKLGEYKKAEKIWKFRFMNDPSLFNYYNYAAFLHQKTKMIFKDENKKIVTLEKLLKDLKYCEKVFKKIPQLIPKWVFDKFKSELDKKELEKKEYIKLKKNSEKQLFYLKQNEDHYKKVLLEEEKKRDEQKISKVQRQKIMEEKQTIKKNKKEEEIIKKKLKEEELEKRARENLEMAKNFKIEWGVKKEKVKKEKKINQNVEEEKNEGEVLKFDPKTTKSKRMRKIKKKSWETNRRR